jgi:hypothetical protein
MSRYAETAIDIGSVAMRGNSEPPVTIEIPGDFGLVLSLIARLSAVTLTAVATATPILWWRLEDSLDSVMWGPVSSPGESTAWNILAKGADSSTKRIIAPIADRLRVRIELRGHNDFSAPRIEGSCSGMALKLGYKRL